MPLTLEELHSSPKYKPLTLEELKSSPKYEPLTLDELVQSPSQGDYEDFQQTQAQWDETKQRIAGRIQRQRLQEMEDDPTKISMISDVTDADIRQFMDVEEAKVAKKLDDYKRNFGPLYDSAVVRAIAHGWSEAAGNTWAMGQRVLGGDADETLRDIGRERQAQMTHAREVDPSTAYAEEMGTGAVSSIMRMAPFIASGAGGAGMMIGDAALSSANSAYTEAKDAGLDVNEARMYALTAGSLEGAITGAFQKFAPGVEKLLSGKIVKQGITQGIKRAGVAAMQELPEEILISIGQQFASANYGVDPNAKSPEALAKGVADTVVQTLMVVGMAGGARQVLGAIPRKEQERFEESARTIASQMEPPPVQVPPVQETSDVQAVAPPVGEAGPQIGQPVPRADRIASAVQAVKVDRGLDLTPVEPKNDRERRAIEFAESRGTTLALVDHDPAEFRGGAVGDVMFVNRNQSKDLFWNTVGHEVAHGTGVDLADVGLTNEDLASITASYLESADKETRRRVEADPQLGQREAMATYVGNLFEDSTFRRKVGLENPTLLGKIVDAVRQVLGGYKLSAVDQKVWDELQSLVKPPAPYESVLDPTETVPTDPAAPDPTDPFEAAAEEPAAEPELDEWGQPIDAAPAVQQQPETPQEYDDARALAWENDILPSKLEGLSERQRAIEQIRKTLKISNRDINRWEDSGKDHSTFPNFDDAVTALVSEHPELGWSDDPAADVWDALKEEKQAIGDWRDPENLREIDDYLAKQGIVNPTAEPEPPPPKEPPASRMPDAEQVDDESVTMARRAYMDPLREREGFVPYDSPQGRAKQEVIDAAITKGIPKEAASIAAQVIKSGREMSDVETAGLLVRAREIQSSRRRLERELGGLVDAGQEENAGDITLLSNELSRQTDELELIANAISTSGSAFGYGLEFQKLAISDEFEAVQVLARARTTKKSDLTQSERDSLQAKVSKLEKDLEAAKSANRENIEDQAEQSLKNADPKRARRKGGIDLLYEKAAELLGAGCDLI